MPAWCHISLADVQAYASQARLDITLEAGVTAEQWVASMISTVVAQIRAKVATCPQNRLDANPSKIPPEYREYAVLTVLSAILSRPGADGSDRSNLALTSDQVRRVERAETDLDQVAKCDLAVTVTDDPEPDPSMLSSQPSPRIRPKTRRWTWDQQEGR
jgi:hypothetical protein